MIAGLIRLLTGAQARWAGCSPDLVQRIYFGNHTSHLDFPVIWASLPDALRLRTRPVAARDYWDATRLRRYLACKVFRAVMIDRNIAAFRDHQLRAMEEAVEAGDSLIIFPEGTRNVDEDAGLRPFKPGLYHLARRFAHLQLVPVRTWRISTASCPRASLSRFRSWQRLPSALQSHSRLARTSRRF